MFLNRPIYLVFNHMNYLYIAWLDSYLISSSKFIFLYKEIIKMAVIKKFFFYGFALFTLTSIIYGMAYDFMIGAEIHYDFYGAGFVAWLVFFGILKEIFGLWESS